MGPTLIFIPDENRPGLADMTGAFLPEAQRYCAAHQLTPGKTIVRFPALKRQMIARREPVLRAIATAERPLSTIAFFSHGYRDGLQAGFAKADIPALSEAIARSCAIDTHVLLYCCDAGRNHDDSRIDDTVTGPGGDGGFADLLRDALEAEGRLVTVMAHATEGHCSWNPYARRFAPNTGGQGGQWYVEPKSPLWPRWSTTLRLPGTFRFRYPRMSSEAIAAELVQRLV